jgi:hypothetical protein
VAVAGLPGTAGHVVFSVTDVLVRHCYPCGFAGRPCSAGSAAHPGRRVRLPEPWSGSGTVR